MEINVVYKLMIAVFALFTQRCYVESGKTSYLEQNIGEKPSRTLNDAINKKYNEIDQQTYSMEKSAKLQGTDRLQEISNKLTQIQNSLQSKSEYDIKLQNKLNRKIEALQSQQEQVIKVLNEIQNSEEIKNIIKDNVKKFTDHIYTKSKQTNDLLTNLGEKILQKIIPNLRNITKDIKGINKTIPKVINKNINQKFESLEKNLVDMEKNINKVENISNNLLPTLKVAIDNKIDGLEKNISRNVENNMNNTFIALEIKLQDMEKNSVLRKSEADKNFEKVKKEFPEIGKNLSNLEKTLNHFKDNLHCKSVADYDLRGTLGNKLSALESRQEHALELLNETHCCSQNRSMHQTCKTAVAEGYTFGQLHPIDDESLQHVILQRDNNDVKHFYMHFAIMAFADGIVKLSLTRDSKDVGYNIEIVFGAHGNTKITIRRAGPKFHNYVNDIVGELLDAARFTAFFINVFNGTLEVGMIHQGKSWTYQDDNLKGLSHVSFGSWYNHRATFLYDCPFVLV